MIEFFHYFGTVVKGNGVGGKSKGKLCSHDHEMTNLTV